MVALATAQPSLSHDASMAKAMASDAADQAARIALQVHGAIGYTWECDLHFLMKRTWALSRAWGDAATHRRLVLSSALAAQRGARFLARPAASWQCPNPASNRHNRVPRWHP